MNKFTKFIYAFLILAVFTMATAFGQGSWINITLLTDNYPVETSWCIINNNNDTIAESQDGMFENTIYEDTVELPSGNYTIYLNDSYGDGLGASQWGGTDGSFVVENTCQGTLMEGYGDFGSQLVESLFIAPCAPPVFVPCSGIINSNTYEVCWGTQTAIIWEWESNNNSSCDVVELYYGDEWGYSQVFGGYWPASNGWNNFAVAAGPGQMPPSWSLEHYMVFKFADGSFSDTLFYTPSPCIPGCTDPSQPTYNPWATVDNGSCAGTTCDTSTQYQITMEITFDNWPNETSWIMNSGGVIDEATPGTYDFNDIGQTYTYDFCVEQSGFELILNDSYGDGMAGSTSGGTMDGYVVIYDCNGDTLWSLTNPAFGNVSYSGVQQGAACYIAPPVAGCTDDDYVEYNPLAVIDDLSCSTLHIYGCTDSTFYNYNSNATINNIIPDCDYTLLLGDAAADGWGNSYIGVYQNEVSLGIFTIMASGEYSQAFPLILDAGIPVEIYYFEVGGPQTPPEEVQFQTWHNSFYLINSLGDTLIAEGTNPFANNGQGALQSFDSPFWTTYSALPYCGDYCEPYTYGCIDSLAVNYDSIKNTDDGSCYYNPGCMNPLYLEYDALYDYNDNSCLTLIVYGCMDSTALNYNPLANVEITNSCIAIVEGCTDNTMFNYNINANLDDGSCVLFMYGCTDVTALNYDSLANTDDGTCIPYIWGCTDGTAFNYDPLSNSDDGSCIDVVFGCTDNTMWNYDLTANTDNGSCIPFYYGCTDSTALNYDNIANTDNGSCIYPLPGCTDATAINYNPLANVADSSCYYSAGCSVGDIYYIPNECFSWVIDVDNFCCNVEWDATCDYLYEYCLDGWNGPTDVQNLRNEMFNIYPNPTDGDVYFTDYVDVKVYNMLGEIIVDKKDVNFVSLQVDNGIYNIVILYKGIIIKSKIIKQ